MPFKSRKHSIELLKQIAKEKDWKLLSEQYLGGSVKHDFICNKGHRISKTMDHFLKGSGCQVCSGKAKLTIIDFKVAAEKNGWELLTQEYKGVTQTLKFKCNKCNHDFSLKSSYLRGKKKVKFCPNCYPMRKKTIEEIKINAPKRGLICLSDDYNGIGNKLLWQCKNNHQWMARPNDIFNNNSGCPECKRYKTEAKVKFALENYFEGKKFPKKSKIKTNFGFDLELDGYNQELNIAFEYNGIQHYEYSPFYHKENKANFEKQRLRDAKKIEYCIKNKIHLIVIPYTAKSNLELADCIINALPENVAKDKVRLNNIFENYERDSNELAPIREKLESINMTLLSKNYTGVSDKNLLIKCLKCDHEYLTSHYRIKRMVTCRNCSVNKTFTIEDLKKIASDNSIILISKEYIPQQKVQWKCHEGHIWDALPTSIKGTKTKKGTNCPTCFGKHKTTIEEVNFLAKSRGHVCCSESIENRDSILTFECFKKVGEVHIWPTSFNSYKKSKNGCPYCTGRKKYMSEN
jgi:hypothetical protein